MAGPDAAKAGPDAAEAGANAAGPNIRSPVVCLPWTQ